MLFAFSLSNSSLSLSLEPSSSDVRKAYEHEEESRLLCSIPSSKLVQDFILESLGGQLSEKPCLPLRLS